MGLLDTLADILTREPSAKPEYGTMSDALAEQAKGYGVTGGLLNAVDPYILDPMNAPEHKWVRQNLAARSAKDMVAPSAEAMERIGMAGIFAGPNAKTANLVALKEAENLAAKGADNEAIRQATGWFKGMDGKWRFEIPDNVANFEPASTKPKTMPEVLGHYDLFSAYPDIMTAKVLQSDASLPRGSGAVYLGNFDGEEGVLLGSLSNNKSSLLHELQHAIQQREGFGRGGSPSVEAWTKPSDRKMLIAQVEKTMREWAPATYEEFWGKEITPEGRTAYQKYLDEFNSKQSQHKRLVAAQMGAPAEIYKNLAGEIEARDVSARMNLTPEQRMATPPDLRSDAIVRYNNTPMSVVLPYD